MGKGIVKLLWRQGPGPRVVGGSSQCWKGHFECREGQKNNAFNRSRRDGNGRYAQATVDQNLRDQTAEGVPDDDWRAIQCSYYIFVVIDDLRHSQRRNR